MTSPSPFLHTTDKPLAALRGRRNGYVQLATSQLVTAYSELPAELLMAARDWAVRLEALGAKRVYWITLSEAVRHLHIHLYPRWDDEEARGIPLFEQRESEPQPPWSTDLQTALSDWAKVHAVEIIG